MPHLTLAATTLAPALPPPSWDVAWPSSIREALVVIALMFLFVGVMAAAVVALESAPGAAFRALFTSRRGHTCCDCRAQDQPRSRPAPPAPRSPALRTAATRTSPARTSPARPGPRPVTLDKKL